MLKAPQLHGDHLQYSYLTLCQSLSHVSQSSPIIDERNRQQMMPQRQCHEEENAPGQRLMSGKSQESSDDSRRETLWSFISQMSLHSPEWLVILIRSRKKRPCGVSQWNDTRNEPEGASSNKIRFSANICKRFEFFFLL